MDVRKFVSGSIFTLAMTSIITGAFAQGSGVTVISNLGNEVALSPAQLYRALGDRLVTRRDVIGNSTLNWNQIDPTLPATRISVASNGKADEARMLDVVRQGCMIATSGSAGCAKVRLRTKLLIQDNIGYAEARFDPQRVSLPAPAYIPPPPAITASTPTTTPSTPATPEATYSYTTITSTPLPPLSPVPKPVVAVPARIVEAPAPDPVAVAETPSAPVFATRLFAQREDYPPANFAAYGIVAFATLATSGDKERYKSICEAYFSTLIDSGSSDAEVERQMVTVWPIIDDHPDGLIDRLNTEVREDGMCEDAVKFYDLAIARVAIRHAKLAGIELSGPGPFLLAWAPGEKKGRKDVAVLVADLGGVKSEADAREALRIWREDIEGDPEFWKNGFSVLKLRAKLRQLVNRYGNDLMKFVGAG